MSLEKSPFFFFGILALLVGHSASAASPEELAARLASEVAAGIKAAGLTSTPVLVRPLRLAEEPALRSVEEPSGTAQAFFDRFVAALVQGELKLVDRQAFDQAMQETKLGALSDTDTLFEIAGGLGAKVMIWAAVQSVPGGQRINVKAVAIATGEILVAAAGTIANGGAEPGEVLSLQGELRRLSDLLAAGLDQLAGEARYQHFAVLPFEPSGTAAKENQLGLLVAAELTTYLQRDHNLLMVERTRIADVIDELALGQTGLVDEKAAVKVGELAGAQALITGSVSATGDRYLVNARVVDTQSAAVVVVERAELPAADLVALSSAAVVLRSTSGAVYRSALLPGWGQFYNRQPVKAGIFIAAEVASLGLSFAFLGLSEERHAYYRGLGSGSQAADFERAWADAASYRDLALAFGLAAAAVHLFNVIDAYLNGVTYDTATPGFLAQGETFAPPVAWR